jgi:hypothetical protein
MTCRLHESLCLSQGYSVPLIYKLLKEVQVTRFRMASGLDAQ